MFRYLGSFVARYRVAVIFAWLILAAGLMLFAPDLASVSSTDQADFLPAQAPFVHAEAVQKQAFPESAASTSIIIIDAGAGNDVHDPSVWAAIASLENWLASDAAPANIIQVFGPISQPDFADKLISHNQRIALVGVSFDTVMDARPTAEAIAAIDEWLADNTPAGLAVYQSGDAALNAQAEESTFTTMDRTIWITIALVIVALLVIYRSPVSPLIPLGAVTVALLVTIGITALLAQAGVIAVLTQLNAILVVVIYGAGTDYCLFLISRFREELSQEDNVQNAVQRTVHLVGETISSSAGTVFVGFLSLTFAEMGTFRSAGPMLAIAIAITLLAGLTLVPALLSLLGRRAFWPGKASHRSSGRWYEATSRMASSRPLFTILVITAIMLPFSVYGLSRDLNYDMVSELPSDIPSVRGYHLLQEQMGGGVVFPLTVVVTERDAQSVAGDIVRLTEELSAIDGVTDVRGLHTPLGSADQNINRLLRVDGQLALLLQMSQAENDADPADPAAALEGIRRYMDILLVHFPDIAADPDFLEAQKILDGGMLAILARQDDLMAAVAGLAESFQAREDAYLLPPMDEGDLFEPLRPLYDEYVSTSGLGLTFKLEVVLADPIGDQGFDAVEDIRNVLQKYQGDGEAVVSGFSVLYADIRQVMDRDMIRAFAFILAGIFLVLLLMLRSVVAPLYLVATVLLSFTCTLGLTNLFFDKVMGVERLSWLLPVFMFVFLVALGIDYSIFLFGRIKEEVAEHGTRQGVHVAVAATGAIITSAGVILAGTFAGMMTGEIAFLAQLGFSVAVGVLIDTFIVRTILDPALAAFFGRFTWWPGGIPKSAHQHGGQSPEQAGLVLPGND
ncbi:MAG: MMPL family transporter [Anaerolineales bacterium]|nr:MMPL family transporter [Anaerolineales bacterium]